MLANVDDTMIYDDVGDVMMMVMMIMMIMLMMNIIHMKYTRFGPSCCRRMRHACMMQTHGVHATHTHIRTCQVHDNVCNIACTHAQSRQRFHIMPNMTMLTTSISMPKVSTLHNKCLKPKHDIYFWIATDIHLQIASVEPWGPTSVRRAGAVAVADMLVQVLSKGVAWAS